MKKKNLFLIALLCAYSTLASAWHVVFSENNTVATIYSDANNQPESGNKDNFSAITYPEGVTNGGDLLKAATTLKFVATDEYPISTLGAFQSAGFAATTVDYSEAHFTETEAGSITYNDCNNDEQTLTYYSNCMTFQKDYFPNVSNAILSPYVRSIWTACFKGNTQVVTFTIPASIQYIARLAVENIPLKSITIPDNVKYIAELAFQNAAIKALVDVTVEGCTTAANKAFDKMATVGQTDADYAAYATLHFPKGKEDYFVNKNDPLTQAVSLNKGKFQAWLDHHHAAAGNGWQEFINSGSGTPIIPTSSVVLRTYSDKKAHIVPLNFRAYLVNEITETGGKYYLHLQEVFAIPKNTGVILYGYVEPDANNRLSYTLPDLTGGGWDSTDPNEEIKPYNRNTGLIKDEDNIMVNCKNFLVPSTTTGHEDGVAVNGPYDTNTAKTKVVDRNFIMGNFWDTTLNSGDNQIAAEDRDSKDYVGFFRVLTGGTLGANKAYLKLPSPDNTTYSASTGEVLFNNPTGMEVIVTNNGRFRNTYWHNPVLSGNWGQRPNSLPVLVKSIGEPGEEEYFLSVNSLENIMEDNGAIYTLQGVKVTNPQKGIYIKNGKKFIIK